MIYRTATMPPATGAFRRPSPSPLGWVALLILGPSCGVEQYREARPDESLSIRWVASDEAVDAEVLPRWDEGEALAVENAVLVGAEHIDHVQLLESGDGPRIIVLDLSDVGRERLREATTDAEGRRLAIVAGGRIVAAPTIREPLTEGEAYVSVDAAFVDRAFEALSE